jgi:type 1 glutamine amidotransferase
MNVLVLTDDRWHPASTPRAGLQPLTGEFKFDWIENAAGWSTGQMAAYPVTILTKSNNVSAQDEHHWMTPEIEAEFLKTVQAGGGLLAIHSGMAGYQNNPVLRGLLGGIFDHHPEQCPVEMAPRQEHPLCAGASAFTLKDEHYFMTLDDPTAEVFMTSRSTHGEQPAGWLRRAGKGKICVLTPGHNPEVWLHPSFQTLLRNALYWCASKPTVD